MYQDCTLALCRVCNECWESLYLFNDFCQRVRRAHTDYAQVHASVCDQDFMDEFKEDEGDGGGGEVGGGGGGGDDDDKCDISEDLVEEQFGEEHFVEEVGEEHLDGVEHSIEEIGDESIDEEGFGEETIEDSVRYPASTDDLVEEDDGLDDEELADEANGETNFELIEEEEEILDSDLEELVASTVLPEETFSSIRRRM